MDLFVVAILLVALRTYHVLARLWKPGFFAQYFTLSIGIEFAIALLVVYCSSVVIITSPPTRAPDAPQFSGRDNGINVVLKRDASQDGMLKLSLSKGGKPSVTIEDTSDTLGPVSVDLAQRGTFSYVFSQALLAGTGPFRIGITVPNPGGLDGNFTFAVPKAAFDVKPGSEKNRTFDAFTVTMLLVAFASLAYALALYFASLRPSGTLQNGKLRVTDIAGFLVAIFIGGNAIAYADASNLWNPYRAECEGDGNMWHVMLPMMAGKPTSQTTQEGCMWGMGMYTYMFPDKDEYDRYRDLPNVSVELIHPPKLIAGQSAELTFRLRETDGSPAVLFVDMEKLLHIVIVSEDESVFAHIHPDDIHPLSEEAIRSSTFSASYVFPKAGTYLISADFAHGLKLETKQFTVSVKGEPRQSTQPRLYRSEGRFEGYHVALKYELPFSGLVSTLQYEIMKNDQPVTNLQPYLSAAMHISVVKNDLSHFLHIHGEVHPPGMPIPPIKVKNGMVVHTMAMMMTPEKFGPKIEAHLIFPSPGLYTIWGEFKIDDKVIPTAFSVRVE